MQDDTEAKQQGVADVVEVLQSTIKSTLHYSS
jgi:hypothetical protein